MDTRPQPPPHSLPLYVVGSLNADLVLSLTRLPALGETIAASSLATYPGGKGANQAVAAGKLGWPTVMVGQVGAEEGGGPDSGARLLLSSLAAAGVDTRYVDCVPGTPTGAAVILLQEASGENSIVIVGGANGSEAAWMEGGGLKNTLADLAATPARIGCVLLQREVPDAVNVAVASSARLANIPVIMDAGGVDAPLPPALLASIDVLSPNETELARLTGMEVGEEDEDSAVRAAAALLDSAPGVESILVKRGAAGSVLVERGGNGGAPPLITSQPAAPVPAVVDTTGAGDCFTAAYAVATLRGLVPADRLRFASAAAGLCVQGKGAGPSMPGEGAVRGALEAWV